MQGLVSARPGKATHSRARQCRATQSKAEAQNKAEESQGKATKAERGRAEKQNKASKADQGAAEQSKTA